MTTKLYATPLSHFARKIRILLSELAIPHELVFVSNLLSSDPADFGGNPILRIPTLVHGAQWVVESDQIARYLVEQHDEQDRFSVCDLNVQQRNILSMINAAMGAEVEIILSARSGIRDTGSLEYFKRYHEVIEHCLQWLELEAHSAWTQSPFSYLDIALTCMWDHFVHFKTVPQLERFTWIAERVNHCAKRASVAESAPAKQGV